MVLNRRDDQGSEVCMSDESPLKLASKNIKAELSSRFPGVSFSVRSRLYSGGNSIGVIWAGGPTREDVETLVRKYEEGSFDGMTDSYVYDEDPQHQEFRRLRGSTKYVMLQRRVV